jgi:urease accessory protein UreE
MELILNIDNIVSQMKIVFAEVPYGIDHTLKVIKNAEDIIQGEDLSAEEKKIISIAAILHDIGAVEALHKYGSLEGVYQEKEGPPIARAILKDEALSLKEIDRICYIIGNHHSPSKIDGLDFQILWEADLLENIQAMEIRKDKEKMNAFIETNFKTASGKNIAHDRLNNQQVL